MLTCHEVLEHLPYESFRKALSEIFRASKSYAVLSIPDASRVYRIDVQIPKIGEIKRLIYSPRRKMSVHNFDGEYYWEIEKLGYPLKRIEEDIQGAGFEIKKTYSVFEFPYHRFFVLHKLKRNDVPRVQ